MVLVFKNIAKSFLFLALLLILFHGFPARADTIGNDLSVSLKVEIGDESEDFNDTTKTVGKGRFVTYLAEVENKGMESLYDLTLIMDTPDYLNYVPNGVTQHNEDSGDVPVPDVEGQSPLAAGIDISSLIPHQKQQFYIRFQVKSDIVDDEVYTLAWASVVDRFSAMPLVSPTVENRISGAPAPWITVVPAYYPAAGVAVNAGFNITYSYLVKNNGGLSAEAIQFTTFLPDNTICVSGCGLTDVGTLEPGQSATVSMTVTVSDALDGVSEIVNIGYNVSGAGFDALVNRDTVIHPIDADAVTPPSGGAFSVTIQQVPSLVLNSSNGNPRPDTADISETRYYLTYQGRRQPYTYPVRSDYGTSSHSTLCRSYTYPQKWNSYFYAYNSSGGGCEDINACPVNSSPVLFNVNTVLPNSAPKMVFTTNIPGYAHGASTSAVNSFMKNGVTNFLVPDFLTESRAVENGATGIVSSTVGFSFSEDRWTYQQTGTTYLCTYYYYCGRRRPPCSIPQTRPIYTWVKSGSNYSQSATASTDITVYTSTAWLKTEKGHVGTNEGITNGSDTEANYVNLGIPGFTNNLTPSSNYTPPGETNADYMIFGKNGTGSFQSASGDAYKKTGTTFPYLQRGDVYDRGNHPRNFYEDMLTREKYGQVIPNQLPSAIYDSIDLGDGKVWTSTGNITIGQAGVNDTVVIQGGQSRIYTTGDVTINGNIKYGASAGSHYNDITSLRIDARNIIINGEVTDVEAMLLARDSFHSGVSKKQLRILGDVIAGQSFWEREPLSEVSPTEFNKPSEHIIEDLRKYVIPAPGDAELPDDYNVWRQVNPSSGQVMDSY